MCGTVISSASASSRGRTTTPPLSTRTTSHSCTVMSTVSTFSALLTRTSFLAPVSTSCSTILLCDVSLPFFTLPSTWCTVHHRSSRLKQSPTSASASWIRAMKERDATRRGAAARVMPAPRHSHISFSLSRFSARHLHFRFTSLSDFP